MTTRYCLAFVWNRKTFRYRACEVEKYLPTWSAIRVLTSNRANNQSTKDLKSDSFWFIKTSMVSYVYLPRWRNGRRIPYKVLEWRNGRRTCLRSRRSDPWRFKSSLQHFGRDVPAEELQANCFACNPILYSGIAVIERSEIGNRDRPRKGWRFKSSPRHYRTMRQV